MQVTHFQFSFSVFCQNVVSQLTNICWFKWWWWWCWDKRAYHRSIHCVNICFQRNENMFIMSQQKLKGDKKLWFFFLNRHFLTFIQIFRLSNELMAECRARGWTYVHKKCSSWSPVVPYFYSCSFSYNLAACHKTTHAYILIWRCTSLIISQRTWTRQQRRLSWKTLSIEKSVDSQLIECSSCNFTAVNEHIRM